MIKASAATEIRALVGDLSGDDEMRREVAVARLSVIGARAVDRLLEAYRRSTDPRTHLAILRALEATGDHRSAPLARQAIGEAGDVGIGAAGVLRSLLTSPHGATAAAALDVLLATALDRQKDQRLRLAAFDALKDMPPDVRTRVSDALRSDPADAEAVRGMFTLATDEAARGDAVWADAVEGRLPDTPEPLGDALVSRAMSAPPNTLRALVDAVRMKEREIDGTGRREWLALRGAVHQALARRGSRVALYDLRETLEAHSTRLPAPYLAALHVIGDVSCLEPLAAAWSHAGEDTTADAEHWRAQLQSAFRTIAAREKITRRHAVMKRIAARYGF